MSTHNNIWLVKNFLIVSHMCETKQCHYAEYMKEQHCINKTKIKSLKKEFRLKCFHAHVHVKYSVEQ